jgi:ANTAR domain-containing protein
MSAGAEGYYENRFEELYVSAREARSRAQGTVRRAERVLQKTQVAKQEYQQAYARAERLHEVWLSARKDRMRYSAYARMQARLASMPVIEQAKGILMARCGWNESEAFDVLRRASQRSNMRVRDLAAKIVDSAAQGAAQPDLPGAQPAAESAALPEVVAAISIQRLSLADAGSNRRLAVLAEALTAAGEAPLASPKAQVG